MGGSAVTFLGSEVIKKLILQVLNSGCRLVSISEKGCDDVGINVCVFIGWGGGFNYPNGLEVLSQSHN